MITIYPLYIIVALTIFLNRYKALTCSPMQCLEINFNVCVTFNTQLMCQKDNEECIYLQDDYSICSNKIDFQCIDINNDSSSCRDSSGICKTIEPSNCKSQFPLIFSPLTVLNQCLNMNMNNQLCQLKDNICDTIDQAFKNLCRDTNFYCKNWDKMTCVEDLTQKLCKDLLDNQCLNDDHTCRSLNLDQCRDSSNNQCQKLQLSECQNQLGDCRVLSPDECKDNQNVCQTLLPSGCQEEQTYQCISFSNEFCMKDLNYRVCGDLAQDQCKSISNNACVQVSVGQMCQDTTFFTCQKIQNENPAAEKMCYESLTLSCRYMSLYSDFYIPSSNLCESRIQINFPSCIDKTTFMVRTIQTNECLQSNYQLCEEMSVFNGYYQEYSSNMCITEPKPGYCIILETRTQRPLLDSECTNYESECMETPDGFYRNAQDLCMEIGFNRLKNPLTCIDNKTHIERPFIPGFDICRDDFTDICLDSVSDSLCFQTEGDVGSQTNVCKHMERNNNYCRNGIDIYCFSIISNTCQQPLTFRCLAIKMGDGIFAESPSYYCKQIENQLKKEFCVEKNTLIGIQVPGGSCKQDGYCQEIQSLNYAPLYINRCVDNSYQCRRIKQSPSVCYRDLNYFCYNIQPTEGLCQGPSGNCFSIVDGDDLCFDNTLFQCRQMLNNECRNRDNYACQFINTQRRRIDDLQQLCTPRPKNQCLHTAEDGSCLKCPYQYYFNKEENKCLKCPFLCRICKSYKSCERCIDSNIFMIDLKSLNCRCRDGGYMDPIYISKIMFSDNLEERDFYQVNLCQPCHETCSQCEGPLQNQCKACYQSPSLNRLEFPNKNKQCACKPQHRPSLTGLDCEPAFTLKSLTFGLQENDNKKLTVSMSFSHAIDKLAFQDAQFNFTQCFELFAIRTRIDLDEGSYYNDTVPLPFGAIMPSESFFSINSAQKLGFDIIIKQFIPRLQVVLKIKNQTCFQQSNAQQYLQPEVREAQYLSEIGPITFNKDKLDSIDSAYFFINADFLRNARQKLMQSEFVQLARSLTILQYITNTFATTSILLIVNQTMPEFAYEWVAMKGTFVFNIVPDWEYDTQDSVVFSQMTLGVKEGRYHTQLNQINYNLFRLGYKKLFTFNASGYLFRISMALMYFLAAVLLTQFIKSSNSQFHYVFGLFLVAKVTEIELFNISLSLISIGENNNFREIFVQFDFLIGVVTIVGLVYVLSLLMGIVERDKQHYDAVQKQYQFLQEKINLENHLWRFHGFQDFCGILSEDRKQRHYHTIMFFTQILFVLFVQIAASEKIQLYALAALQLAKLTIIGIQLKPENSSYFKYNSQIIGEILYLIILILYEASSSILDSLFTNLNQFTLEQSKILSVNKYGVGMVYLLVAYDVIYLILGLIALLTFVKQFSYRWENFQNFQYPVLRNLDFKALSLAQQNQMNELKVEQNYINQNPLNRFAQLQPQIPIFKINQFDRQFTIENDNIFNEGDVINMTILNQQAVQQNNLTNQSNRNQHNYNIGPNEQNKNSDKFQRFGVGQKDGKLTQEMIEMLNYAVLSMKEKLYPLEKKLL